MIVVDIGCQSYPEFPEDESIHKLIDRFHPSILYGFDPHPSVIKTSIFEKGCRILIEPKAAWVYDGFVGYVLPPAVMNPLRAYTAEEAGPAAVLCFDLATFLEENCFGAGDVVLKLDAEGAEFPLLEHLIQREADQILALLLVEWHSSSKEDEQLKTSLLSRLRCEVEEWT